MAGAALLYFFTWHFGMSILDSWVQLFTGEDGGVMLQSDLMSQSFPFYPWQFLFGK